MFRNIYNNIDFFQKALDGTWERDKAIKKNIANVNTPNYKREVVSFEDQLKGKINDRKLRMTTTNEKHIKNVSEDFNPIKTTDNSGAYRIDGNNVDIDVESGNMAKNNIMYDALAMQIITEGSK